VQQPFLHVIVTRGIGHCEAERTVRKHFTYRNRGGSPGRIRHEQGRLVGGAEGKREEGKACGDAR
jgi:hypothetical protein